MSLNGVVLEMLFIPIVVCQASWNQVSTSKGEEAQGRPRLPGNGKAQPLQHFSKVMRRGYVAEEAAMRDDIATTTDGLVLSQVSQDVVGLPVDGHANGKQD